MTDHTLPDVVVTGQRARGPSPFSGLHWPSKGGSSVEGDQEQTTGEGENTGGSPLSDEAEQCATPEGRKEWNKDAKAVEAIDKFLRAAFDRYGETHLFNREYGALLCEFSGGHIELGPIRDGPFVGPPTGGRGGVDIPVTDCGAGTPVGFVHSHNSSNALPSPPDMGYLEWLASQTSANLAAMSVYVVAAQAGAPAANPHSVSRTPYSDKEASQSPDYVPEWVNPDATLCPE